MKVSVCLATYNGAAFLHEQLVSLLADLESDDEVIMCDDGSSDQTVSVAQALADSRLKIFSFSENVRHVRNFERALALATGDLIFLSDQDDIWKRGKRAAIVAEFERSPETSLVVHALELINRDGRVLEARTKVWPSWHAGLQSTFRYLARQVIKNQVTGCATAFPRRLLDTLLPFPDAVYAHDHWLSVMAPFHGKVIFLDKPLVSYRQHEANVTPKIGLSAVKRIRVRAKLSFLIFIAFFRSISANRRAKKELTQK